jgi:RNA polymerase sigma-70 factor (ECF subfamily)
MGAGAEEQSDLADAVDHLPRLEQKAVEMFYLNGMTVREIARHISVPVGTVKSRLFHARRDLRRLLEEE